MKINNVHCLFEQSGTFKNEFKKLGINAFDYDINNTFNETDYVLDLFQEINNAYNNKFSIFDNFTSEDLLFAFFPCIRFESQIIMHFKGCAGGMDKWSLEKKLLNCIKLHTELHNLYTLICKLVIVCKRRNLRLIIENPYSTQSYLTRYWCVAPTCLDMDRRFSGDNFVKPTQYFFINCCPSNNLIFEDIKSYSRDTVDKTQRGIKRSLITSVYANRFIKELIL